MITISINENNQDIFMKITKSEERKLKIDKILNERKYKIRDFLKIVDKIPQLHN